VQISLKEEGNEKGKIYSTGGRKKKDEELYSSQNGLLVFSGEGKTIQRIACGEKKKEKGPILNSKNETQNLNNNLKKSVEVRSYDEKGEGRKNAFSYL